MSWTRARSITPSTVYGIGIANDVSIKNDIYASKIETVYGLILIYPPVAETLAILPPSDLVECTPLAGVLSTFTEHDPVIVETIPPDCSIAVIPQSVAILTPFSIQVTLTMLGGSPITGKSVYLMYRHHGVGQFVLYEGRSTDYNGSAWFNDVILSSIPTGGWDFKVIYYGDEFNDGTESDISTVAVTDTRMPARISLTVDADQWSGETFTVTVQSPVIADGSPITLQRSYDAGATWSDVGTTTMVGGVCTVDAVENSPIVSTILRYRAVFAGDRVLAPVNSMGAVITINPSVDTSVWAEIDTYMPLVGTKYNLIAHVGYVDQTEVISLAGADVEVYTYVNIPPNTDEYMLVDIAHTDINGRMTFGLLEGRQVTRHVKIVVPNQTVNDVRYNQSETSLVWNVRNPLSLITAPLIGGSVPVLDAKLAAEFAYKQEQNR